MHQRFYFLMLFSQCSLMLVVLWLTPTNNTDLSVYFIITTLIIFSLEFCVAICVIWGYISTVLNLPWKPYFIPHSRIKKLWSSLLQGALWSCSFPNINRNMALYEISSALWTYLSMCIFEHISIQLEYPFHSLMRFNVDFIPVPNEDCRSPECILE